MVNNTPTYLPLYESIGQGRNRPRTINVGDGAQLTA